MLKALGQRASSVDSGTDIPATIDNYINTAGGTNN
jgi:hypothetical protein